MNKIYSLVEKLKDDKEYIDLTDGNFGKPEFFTSEMKNTLNKSFSEYIDQRNYKPDSKGGLQARESISEYYQKLNLNINNEQIVITASTSEAYNLIFQSLASLKDEILMPVPSYPLFEYIVEANHLIIKTYKLLINNNWQPDIKEIESKITKKTKFILLINPNNPTGTIIADETFKDICELCKKNNIYLMIDHVFEDYSDVHTDYFKFIDSTNVIFINGISKLLALPDLKLGWIAMPNKDCSDIEKIEIMNDMYLGANTFIQFAFTNLIKIASKTHKQINQRLAKNREILYKTLNSTIYIFVRPNAGIHTFIGIDKLKTKYKSEDELCIDLLKKEKILVHPGYFYDYADKNYLYICFSLLQEQNIFKSSLERLNNLLIQN